MTCVSVYCIHVYIYMYIYIYIFLYAYIHIHRYTRCTHVPSAERAGKECDEVPTTSTRACPHILSKLDLLVDEWLD